MKVLALETQVPGGTFTEEILRREARKVWELYQSGVIREMYFSASRHRAVLVLESAGPDEARAALAELPLVQAGAIDFELHTLVPYPGFARLFEPGAEQAQPR
ncbi:MAG TPA: superoxide dismutase [Candidatus Binatia bacterium]|nr:superoxide dismutase [Candidatus Binatia bacterium]